MQRQANSSPIACKKAILIFLQLQYIEILSGFLERATAINLMGDGDKKLAKAKELAKYFNYIGSSASLMPNWAPNGDRLEKVLLSEDFLLGEELENVMVCIQPPSHAQQANLRSPTLASRPRQALTLSRHTIPKTSCFCSTKIGITYTRAVALLSLPSMASCRRFISGGTISFRSLSSMLRLTLGCWDKSKQ